MDPTQVDELKHMGQLKHGGRVKDQVMSESLYHFLSFWNLSTCQINMQHLIVSWMGRWETSIFFFLSFFLFHFYFCNSRNTVGFFHIFLGSKKLSFITSKLLCDSCSLFFGNWVLEQVKGFTAWPMYWFFLVSILISEKEDEFHKKKC